MPRNPTHFEEYDLVRLLESFLYTSDNMFGDIITDAERELYRRVPPPKWCFDDKGKPKSGCLPIVSQEWYNEDGTRKAAESA